MSVLEFLFVPTILFLTLVAPIWLVMHYRSIKHSSRSLNQQELQVIEEMLVDLDKLADRIDALESILEHDHPNWRKQRAGGRETERETE